MLSGLSGDETVVRENADVITRYGKDHDMAARQEVLVMLEHAVQTACASIFHRGQTVRFRTATRTGVTRVNPQWAQTIQIPLSRGADGRCVVHFAVSPTAVPGKGDSRRLGLHFTGFAYSP